MSYGFSCHAQIVLSPQNNYHTLSSMYWGIAAYCSIAVQIKLLVIQICLEQIGVNLYLIQHSYTIWFHFQYILNTRRSCAWLWFCQKLVVFTSHCIHKYLCFISFFVIKKDLIICFTNSDRVFALRDLHWILVWGYL